MISSSATSGRERACASSQLESHASGSVTRAGISARGAGAEDGDGALAVDDRTRQLSRCLIDHQAPGAPVLGALQDREPFLLPHALDRRLARRLREADEALLAEVEPHERWHVDVGRRLALAARV